jgi:hypothetical protein
MQIRRHTQNHLCRCGVLGGHRHARLGKRHLDVLLASMGVQPQRQRRTAAIDDLLQGELNALGVRPERCERRCHLPQGQRDRQADARCCFARGLRIAHLLQLGIEGIQPFETQNVWMIAPLVRRPPEDINQVIACRQPRSIGYITPFKPWILRVELPTYTSRSSMRSVMSSGASNTMARFSVTVVEKRYGPGRPFRKAGLSGCRRGKICSSKSYQRRVW